MVRTRGGRFDAHAGPKSGGWSLGFESCCSEGVVGYLNRVLSVIKICAIVKVGPIKLIPMNLNSDRAIYRVSQQVAVPFSSRPSSALHSHFKCSLTVCNTSLHLDYLNWTRDSSDWWSFHMRTNAAQEFWSRHFHWSFEDARCLSSEVTFFSSNFRSSLQDNLLRDVKEECGVASLGIWLFSSSHSTTISCLMLPTSVPILRFNLVSFCACTCSFWALRNSTNLSFFFKSFAVT